MSGTSIYLPDTLYGRVEAFAKSSDVSLDEAFRQLLSKGLVSKSAREYLELLLQKNFLKRSELYAEYSRDGVILTRLAGQMRDENAELRRHLTAKGLLRIIPEKRRP